MLRFFLNKKIIYPKRFNFLISPYKRMKYIKLFYVVASLLCAVITEMAYASDYRERPTKKMLPLSIQTKHFCIHYTLDGLHSVQSYETIDGLNPFLLDIKYYLEANWYKFVVERHYKAPLVDDTLGGGQGLYDVYIVDLPIGENGEVHVDAPKYKHQNKPTMYMLLSKKLSRVDIYGGNPLSATIAHEFFHMIQNRYYGSAWAAFSDNGVTTALSTSLREGTAVWAETVCLQSVINLPEMENTNYLHYLNAHPGMNTEPHRPLLINEEATMSQYAYTTVFFWKYLAERLGEQVIWEIWEKIGTLSGATIRLDQEMQVLEDVLANYGGLTKMVRDYWITTYQLAHYPENYKEFQKKYPQYTFEAAMTYQKFIRKAVFLPLVDLATVDALNTSIATKVPDLSAMGGANFHALNLMPDKSTKLIVKPLLGTPSLKSDDLYAVLLKQNSQSQNLVISFKSFDTAYKQILFEVEAEANVDYSLIIFRLTPPETANKRGLAQIRYRIEQKTDLTTEK